MYQFLLCKLCTSILRGTNLHLVLFVRRHSGPAILIAWIERLEMLVIKCKWLYHVQYTYNTPMYTLYVFDIGPLY